MLTTNPCQEAEAFKNAYEKTTGGKGLSETINPGQYIIPEGNNGMNLIFPDRPKGAILEAMDAYAEAKNNYDNLLTLTNKLIIHYLQIEDEFKNHMETYSGKSLVDYEVHQEYKYTFDDNDFKFIKSTSEEINNLIVQYNNIVGGGKNE